MTVEGRPKAQVRVVIADDHRVVLAGLRSLIQSASEMQIIGEAADGRTALRLALKTKPDVVVLDLSMPGMSGAQVAQALHASLPECRVLVLSVHEDRGYLRQLIEAGISGYVLKRSAPEELIAGIRAVAAGGLYLDPSIAGMIVGREPKAGPKRGGWETAELSSREIDVLRLAAAGYSNKEISARFQVGLKSTETYKARGMEKLGLRTRAELVRYAVSKGWLNS